MLWAYLILVVGASLVGGLIPAAVRLTHRRLELALSFVAGTMLGVAALELVPHAWAEQVARTAPGNAPSIEGVVGWTLAGVLSIFLVERFLCFHHHDPTPHLGEAQGHAHDQHWVGALVGLVLHSLVAGVALGAAFDRDASVTVHLPAFGVFLAVVLHKPFDSLTLGTLMVAEQRPRRQQHLVNVLFSLAVPLGVLLERLGGAALGDAALLGPALAFAAGTFFCIALSDLLPELQFHRHDRAKLTAALATGLLLAWAASHAHPHP